ncbi:helix-turn-helix domain-containing protein, partial [Sellimonas catena]
LPKDQLLRLHYYSYPLVLPPSFETILSNAGRDLKVRMITYLQLVVKVIAGNSRTDVALKDGFSPRMLYQWVQKYKIQGYNGLIEQQKGHSCKNLKMKKKENPAPLTESEREELICLRAENEYIKAENEVIEKQQSLKNFAKKDIS